MSTKISKEEYANACAEVLEILKSVKDEDLKRIPNEEIEILKENANMEHEFSHDATKDIKEQNVSKASKGIIANFFVKYIATMEQKQKITSIQHKRLEEKLVANNTPRIETEETETTIPKVQIKDLVDVKDIKWYEKVYLFLKRIFGKKNK